MHGIKDQPGAVPKVPTLKGVLTRRESDNEVDGDNEAGIEADEVVELRTVIIIMVY